MSNNPAGQLSAILRQARDINGSAPTWKAWADVFRADVKKPAGIYPILTKLSRVADEIQSAVEKNCQSRRTLLLRYMGATREIIGPTNLEVGWEVYRSKITEEVLFALDFCDSELSAFYPGEEFLQELPGIKQELTWISEKIVAGNLPIDLKNLILGRIEELLVAVDNYELFRLSGIEQGVQAVVGVLALNNTAIQSDEQSKPWLDKLRESLEAINRSVRVMYAGVQLGETITKLIGRG